MADAFLKDWHIVIMRPRHQAQSLMTLVKSHWGVPIILPMQEILPLPISTDIDNIKRADIVIVTSANAVYCAPAPILEAIKQARCVTMGKATSLALTEKNIPIYFTAPKGSTSESLLEQSFLHKKMVQSKNIILLAGEGGRTVLHDKLRDRGARVTWLKVYRQQQPHIDINFQLFAWQQYKKICLIATSSRSLENLLNLSSLENHAWLKQQPMVVVSTRIAQQAREWGFQHIVEAKAAHPEDILNALQEMANDYDKMAL